MKRWLGAGLAITLALLIAVTIGYSNYRVRLHEGGAVTVGTVGEPVTVGDRTFTVTRLETAPGFPAVDPADEPVTAVPGAVLVLVVVRTDHGPLDPRTSYCRIELLDKRGDVTHRTWRSTEAFVYRLDVPQTATCTSDDPTSQVTELAVGYQVPADAVPHLVVRVGQEDSGWAEIRR